MLQDSAVLLGSVASVDFAEPWGCAVGPWGSASLSWVRKLGCSALHNGNIRDKRELSPCSI